MKHDLRHGRSSQLALLVQSKLAQSKRGLGERKVLILKRIHEDSYAVPNYFTFQEGRYQLRAINTRP